MAVESIYDPTFVKNLFNEMARTYGVVNLISSFGFAALWRKQCVRRIAIPCDSQVLDLMTGMGELCAVIVPSLGEQGRIVGVDLSSEMCARARQHTVQRRCVVEILEADALASSLPSGSADVIVSSFGLKTFSPDQINRLADEVARLLKPGGVFSFLEISVPPSRFLRWPYLTYIRSVIPTIGRVFLGNPDNYRMLGIYTERFGNCSFAAEALARAGLNVQRNSYFFGCATGVSGRKPE